MNKIMQLVDNYAYQNSVQAIHTQARGTIVKAIQAQQDYTRAVISERDEALKECEEQARLLGMSGSREAALLSERDQLRKELAELKLAYAECSRQKNELLTKHKQMANAEPACPDCHAPDVLYECVWCSATNYPPKEKTCKYGDKSCPCQDGDTCHYEGKNPMKPPKAEPVQEPFGYFQTYFSPDCGDVYEFYPLAEMTSRDPKDYTPLYAAPQDGLRKAAQMALKWIEAVNEPGLGGSNVAKALRKELGQ
jgi:hypothetical protein